MWVRRIEFSSEMEVPCLCSSSRSVARVEEGPGSMSANESCERTSAHAIERGRPSQLRSMTVVECTRNLSLSKAEREIAENSIGILDSLCGLLGGPGGH